MFAKRKVHISAALFQILANKQRHQDSSERTNCISIYLHLLLLGMGAGQNMIEYTRFAET